MVLKRATKQNFQRKSVCVKIEDQLFWGKLFRLVFFFCVSKLFVNIVDYLFLYTTTTTSLIESNRRSNRKSNI
jgi:hypothetical protein